MKRQFLQNVIVLLLLFVSRTIFGQAPTLGTAADYVLFTTTGAVGNTGPTHLTGNVGSNSGSSTGFGNVDGGMHDGDAVSALAAADLTIAYNQLNLAVPTGVLGVLMGSGQIVTPGVYSISGPATLDLDLSFDALGDPNAVFIVQINGAFASSAMAKVHLVNGALACNVFWKVEGSISLATGTTMRGTMVANNAAITMDVNDTIEGRMLSTTGAITINDVTGRIPLGCGRPVLVGPIPPLLASIECYALFSTIGPVTNVGITYITGDVGTNNGLTTGFNPLFVTGTIHPIPDASTVACATDLLNVYNYMSAMPNDIELLAPTLFGNGLVLTPHTYVINGATTFTDTLILDAQGSPEAVFTIKIYGAFSTSVYSYVKLINGAQSNNVYWLVEGALSINDYSVFRGTVIVNNAAINLNTGMTLDGRALTTTGAVNTSAINIVIPPASITAPPITQVACIGDSVVFTVSSSGSTYQWRRGLVNLVDTGNISGSQTSRLVIYPVGILDTAFNYNVVIGAGACGGGDTSFNVALVVNPPAIIIREPSNVAACIGDSINFTVLASDSSVSYQWRRGTVNLIDTGTISGTHTARLIIDSVAYSDTASNYNVIITGGSCLSADTSIIVSLTVGSNVVISREPINVIACVGDSINFTVLASGTGLTYQWRKGTVNLIDSANISGSNTSRLIINPTSISDTSSLYNVIVSGGLCSSPDTSINVSLTIGSGLVISGEPINVIACAGDSINFSVLASGTGWSYQWRKGTVNLIDTGNISGSNTSRLIINPTSISDTSSLYNVIVSGGSCAGSDTSINVSLTIGATIVISGEPVDAVACAGDSISFSVLVSGTGLSYQWRKGTENLIDTGNISGSNTSRLIINPTSISDTSSLYNVIVSGGSCGGSDTSINVSLTIGATIVISGEPVDVVACAGDSISFSVLVSGTGLSYQWRNGTVNLIDTGNISGSNTSRLTINPSSNSDASTFYNVIVSGGPCALSDTSINVRLSVNALPIAMATTNSPVCVGDTILLIGNSSVGVSYRWTNSSGFISSIATAVIVPATFADSGYYQLIVTENSCNSLPVSVFVSVVNCGTDLVISKTINDSIPFIGDAVLFTIQVTNIGQSNATGVIVTDMLPTGYTFVSSTASVGSYNALTGIWTIGSLNVGDSAYLSIAVIVDASGDYVNTATIQGNEMDVDMLNNIDTATAIPTDFNIPEGFSPNGDGVNDVFVIRGIDHYPSNSIVIFNRWGNKVYEISPYQNAWDGKATKGLLIGGDDLPVGTYFYVLELGDGTKFYKGTIYLNK